MGDQQGTSRELPYYRLWNDGHWFDEVFEVEERYRPTVRSLFPKDMSDEGVEILLDAELVPELDGPVGEWSIAIRIAGRTIGYLSKEQAVAWASVIRRVVASGCIPVTASRIYAREYDGFDGLELQTNSQVALGDPSDALPQNQPPEVPYTMLPKSSILEVTKEEQYFEALQEFIPPSGHGVFFATLHERPAEGRRNPVTEVRIDGRCIGQLTPQTSQRFLPMIRHFDNRGLQAACWSDVTGSPVAAEVRIRAIKAHEASDEVLNGLPATVPRLVPELSDPSQYDLRAVLPRLKPLNPVQEAPKREWAEPPEGAVIRFTKRRRYNYVAVRYREYWLTTATGYGGGIEQVMYWKDLSPRLIRFDYAVAVDPVNLRDDPRLRAQMAVVCFMLGDFYVSAINVCENGSRDGDWYTTIPDELESSPLGSGRGVTWTEISRYASYPRVVTSWSHYE